MMKLLYFIALLPPPQIEQRIKGLKMEMRFKYYAKHALKLPAHITMVPPFRLEEGEEGDLINFLMIYAGQQEAFDVKLNGFGSFPPKVLFVKVLDNGVLVKLQEELVKSLQKWRGKKDSGPSSPFHPHITIATKDLGRREFQEAWEGYKDRSFFASFPAERFFLLQHNGKSWVVRREFPFHRGKRI